MKKYKISTYLMILIFSGYLFIYWTASLNGEYGLSPTGNKNYSFGFSMADRLQWDPNGMALRLTGVQAFEMNGVGLIFSPLIVMDRYFWHKDVVYF